MSSLSRPPSRAGWDGNWIVPRAIDSHATGASHRRQQRQELERQIAVIGQEQERIRGNMAETPKESELFRRYLTKFSAQEDNIEALRSKVTANIEQEQKLRKSLDEFLIGLELA